MSAQQGRLVVTPNQNNRELIEQFRLAADAVGVSYTRALEQGMRMWMEWAAQHWSGIPTPPPAKFGWVPPETEAAPLPFTDPAPVPSPAGNPFALPFPVGDGTDD